MDTERERLRALLLDVESHYERWLEMLYLCVPPGTLLSCDVTPGPDVNDHSYCIHEIEAYKRDVGALVGFSREARALEADETGFLVAPKRYSAHGRETIDRLRDAAPALMMRALSAGLSVGDAAFAVYSALNAMKYDDRSGHKGAAEHDRSKSEWYQAMWHHVLGSGPDPRQYRADFVSYERQDLPLRDSGLLADLTGYFYPSSYTKPSGE